MQQFTIDAEGLATYGRHAEEVTERLTTAARHVTAATDAALIARLTADIGEVGSDFTARAAALLAGHAETLTAAATLVAQHRENLGQLGTAAVHADTETAAALARRTHTIEGLV